MIRIAILILLFLSVLHAEAVEWPADGTAAPGKSGVEKTAPPAPSLESQLAECVRNFDDRGLDKLVDEATSELTQTPANANLQLLIAKSYLARCDLRRFKRKTMPIEKAEDKTLREHQAILAEQGVTYAEKAVALEPESSEAHRVLGELYIHEITGPIAAFRYGPKGKSHLESAMELDANNPEAKRAYGLMYLYNPPFNGGDRKKAASTFDQLGTAGGDDRVYVLAGRAYIELEQPQVAVDRLKKALEINPRNLEAQELLKQLGEQP